MNEQQTIEQIKARLNKFIEDIDHVNLMKYVLKIQMNGLDCQISLKKRLNQYLSKCHIRCVRVRYRDSRLIFLYLVCLITDLLVYSNYINDIQKCDFQ